jgi:hypothetical protein
VLVLYDSSYDRETAFVPAHQIAEMPLNHLGLITDFVDINRGLPRVEEMNNVRGVLTWFRSDTMANPMGFLKWSEEVLNAGIKFVVIGDLGVSRDFKNQLTPMVLINRFWSRLGLKSENDWNIITYDWKVSHKESTMVEFERELFGVLPAFARMRRIEPRAKTYLTLRRGNDPATDNHLVVIHPRGAYVAGGYMHFSTSELHGRQWYVNPFEFFRLAFGTDDLPKPDTTTLSGRRIFYSHVDGDGWRNVTEVTPYRKQRRLAPYVVLKEIIEKFRDLPVTIAPIAADLDTTWHGTKETVEIAKQIFTYPHVEAGSHTYAHPLEWSALEGPTAAAARAPIEPKQPLSFISGLFADTSAAADLAGASERKLRYEQPITYHDRPFDLNREIFGAVAFINRLLPPGKNVEIVQWSGDTLPFEAALAAVRSAGLRNLNGGDTRFDREYQSYGWVSPLSRQVGKQRQIYASNSNENTYTNLWTERFFGFKYLIRTVDNTEAPIRLKPHNVYYHMYSGEKLSSLLAVMENYSYARTKEIAPVAASRYAAIADGFFSAEVVRLDEDRWMVRNRGSLSTIRFDHATLRAVDFSRSEGVVGQRHYQGSLYVALDSARGQPIIALQSSDTPGRFPDSPTPYLVHGRWEVSHFELQRNAFSFRGQGFGKGELLWRMPLKGTFRIRVEESGGAVWEQLGRTNDESVLHLNLGQNGIKPVLVTVSPFEVGVRR